MPPRYADIFEPQEEFQRAVNLSLDLGNLTFVEKYIPTKASVAVIERYLQAILYPSADRASVLIGPYGKGKSHALFLVLSLISEDSPYAEQVFERLAEKVENISFSTAENIRRIRKDGIRMLPVVINDRYLDIRQAFLASLKTALSQVELSDIMPDNYYQRCLETIERWNKDFPSTHSAYTVFLRNKGISSVDFENSLRQYAPEALALFRECHRSILSGAEFDPLLESDIPTLYEQVAKVLEEKSNYSGLFIVFDEFGKYLENSASYHEAPKFKVLQDLAELCEHIKKPSLLMTCISHKAISEYASRLHPDKQTSFRTVEGRFSSIYFSSTFEGNFSLISGALGRNRVLYQEFLNNYQAEHARTMEACENLRCFLGYESSIDQIISQSFPMHPLTTLALMKLSEQAAQNERTLFTFLADPTAPLSDFIRNNDGRYELATVDMVYDYFHATIRESSYDPEVRDLIIYADALIPTLDINESKLIRAIVLFAMLVDNCLLAKPDVLCEALQWDLPTLQSVVARLEQAHRIYTRRSDGVLCLMRNATESIRHDIEHEVALRKGRIDLASQLSELRDPGYTIPRRYNDRYEIVRYFMNVFVTADQFMRQPNASFLVERGFADGYVIYLLGDLTSDIVQKKLQEWNAQHVVVLLPQIPFTCKEAIEECSAIQRLLDKTTDEVVSEELSYYFDDMLQVVSRCFAELFETNPLCISATRVVTCKAIGSEISRLCEEVLYPSTPVINHEMMNRSSITGIMKQARCNVINAILAEEKPEKAFAQKSAEAAILRAVFVHSEDERMQEVVRIIREFLLSAEEGMQPISILYDRLMKPPYGMRKGILPILLANELKSRLNQTTIYNHLQEQILDGETLNLLDDHLNDYSILVDRGSADQQAYLELLRKTYTPNESTINLRSIHEAMCKIIRSLPRCARANRKVLALDVNGGTSNQSLPDTVLEIRSALLLMENNARDTLVVKFPKICGSNPNEDCAKRVIDAVNNLIDYAKTVRITVASIIRKQLGSTSRSSVHGAMVAWLQQQPATKLNRAFDTSAAALLNVMRCQEDYSEAEWIDKIAIALTSLPLEDWSDQQAAVFPSLLEAALSEIEEAPEEDETAILDAHIQVSLNGRKLSQPLSGEELFGLSAIAYDSMRSTLEEFGEALTTDEKLLVLANLIVRLNEKE